ncbi:MAG: hypothetical protein Q8O00_15720 [Holophaga sp.]|nr:hypothetical protein [Holophaga sp.]
MNFIDTLTNEQKQDLIHMIMDKPCAQTCFYLTPEDEDAMEATSVYFGITVQGDVCHAWSYAEDIRKLELEGSFKSRSDAEAYLKNMAQETQEIADQALEDYKDMDWKERPISTVLLEGPFRFTDNTGFEEGWEMEMESNVFDFFRSHSGLLHPKEWGSLYACDLVDSNGTPCWVARSHRGEMRLEGFESD